jgi:hypothetical protein
MNIGSDDSDNDDNILCDNDISTDDSEHDKTSKTKFIEHPKKPSNTRKHISKKFFSIETHYSLFI